MVMTGASVLSGGSGVGCPTAQQAVFFQGQEERGPYCPQGPLLQGFSSQRKSGSA